MKRTDVVINRRYNKIKLILYKGGKCEICGYDKKLASAYDFHHNDPKEKEFGIAQKLSRLGFESLKKEVDKCTLLCRNCHATLHSLDEDLDENLWSKAEQEKDKPIFVCSLCGKEDETKPIDYKYCSLECKRKASRKVVDRPTKEKLIEMLKTETKTSIGKMYGVSSTTIKKWLVS